MTRPNEKKFKIGNTEYWLYDTPEGTRQDFEPPDGWRLPAIWEGERAYEEGFLPKYPWWCWVRNMKTGQVAGLGGDDDIYGVGVGLADYGGRARGVLLVKEEKEDKSVREEEGLTMAKKELTKAERRERALDEYDKAVSHARGDLDVALETYDIVYGREWLVLQDELARIDEEED